MTLSDENAFGVLIGYHALEHDEYALEPADFAARFVQFRAAVRACVEAFPLAENVLVRELGHAVYLEFPDGDQKEDPIGWIKLVQCLRATGMPIEDLHQYAMLMQQGDETAKERLELLEAHRRRINDEMSELQIALELVERKIDGYDQILRRAQVSSPPTHRPGPRKVRIRPAS